MASPRIPAPTVTAELSALLDQAQLALWRLDGAFSAHADAAAFGKMQQLREAVLSRRIENSSSTFAAVLATAFDQDGDESSADAEAAMRCRRALERGLAESSAKPLDLDFVAGIQAALTENTPGAEALAGSGLQDAGADLAAGLVELDEFLAEPGELPDLVRVGVAQAQIRRLLPAALEDGSLERIVGLAMFRRIGVPGAGGLAMSPYFQSNRREYHARLRGPLEPWLAFFVQGVVESATQAAEMIHMCAVLAHEHRENIAGTLGHAVGRGLRVFRRLTTEPMATVSDVQAITGTSYVAANQLVARFVELGILEEITGYRRNRQFQYGAYVRIFDPDASAPPQRRETRPVSKPRRRKVAAKPRQLSPARGAPKPPRRRSPSFSDHLL